MATTFQFKSTPYVASYCAYSATYALVLAYNVKMGDPVVVEVELKKARKVKPAVRPSDSCWDDSVSVPSWMPAPAGSCMPPPGATVALLPITVGDQPSKPARLPASARLVPLMPGVSRWLKEAPQVASGMAGGCSNGGLGCSGGGAEDAQPEVLSAARPAMADTGNA